MKNKNKYLNLISGMALLALNGGGILFAALASYGLLMIRNFATRVNDKNLKQQSEALIGFTIVRAVVGVLGLYVKITSLSYLLITMNIAVLVLTFIVYKNAIEYVAQKLAEYELYNSINKIKESFYVILGADTFLVMLLLLIVLTVLYPIPLLINLSSLYLNETINLIISVLITLIKYLASRSFTKAGSILMNAISYETETSA